MKFALGFVIGTIIGRRAFRGARAALDGLIYSKRY